MADKKNRKRPIKIKYKTPNKGRFTRIFRQKNKMDKKVVIKKGKAVADNEKG